MARLIRYLLVAWMPFFFSACATMRYCPIETLQPAQLTIDAPRKSIAICASQTILSDAILTNESAAGIHADSLIANILFSLQHTWERAPGFDDTQFSVHMTENDELPDASDYDLMVRLDGLQINNTYYGQEYSYLEWEAYLHVQYAAKWSIRTGDSVVLDEYTDRDLIVWPSGIRLGKADAVANLPDVKDAWWDMGIALAQRCAVRVAPQWQKELRPVYMVNSFPELSPQAFLAMQNSSYARVADIWETAWLSCRKWGQKRTKSQIAYNLAVACEFQNRLDEAIRWAQQSAGLKQRYRTADYLNRLRERKEQQKLLDRQTTP